MTASPVALAEEAARAASEAVDVAEGEVIEQVVAEATKARAVAEEYAAHLAFGGDPTEYENPSYQHVDSQAGIRVVYYAWNRARGSRNPISPFGGDGRGSWRVAELLFARFGEPVPFAILSETGTTEFAGFGSDRIQELLRKIAEKTSVEIVPRRTKVDGKVAYLIRDRREGDEDRIDDDGRYRAKAEGWDREIQEER